MMRTAKRYRCGGRWAVVACAGFGAWLVVASASLAEEGSTARERIAVPAEATPTMAFDEVRVGMRGYGKAVFHGDRIEPFPFVVVSVVSDSSAKRGTIWVECTGERMRRSGPVQGMSGSPMYVWDEGEPETLGEGGRLIGAFAFGYPDVNVCLVGVQPIEYMREVGGRAIDEPLEEPAARGVEPGTMGRALSALAAGASASGTDESSTLGLTAVQRLVGSWSAERRAASASATPPKPYLPPTHDVETNPAAASLGLPLALGSDDFVPLIGPLFESAGLVPTAGALTNVAGRPPSNVDPERVKLEPGAVLSIPLAFGDLDLNAAGTVTDVMPDGTVLAFGHAMNAVGSARMPMATGYTHFVVSRDSISFKLGSSLDIVGSVVRDEASAVAGVPDPGAFATADVAIAVAQPGQPKREYDYRLIDSPSFTPPVLAALANASLTAVQAPPVLHTLRTTGTLTFTGGRTFTLDSVVAGEGINGLVFDLLPPVAVMMLNPFDPLSLESVDLTMTVEDELRSAQLRSARLDRTVARPGETIQITAVLQPFDAPAAVRTLPFELPSDLPEGEYQLLIGGADSYTYRMLASRPELAAVDDVDEALAALQAVADVDRQTVYVSLPLPTPGVAVGGRGLPGLPSSRAAVLGATASSQTTPYPRFAEAKFAADHVVQGELVVNFRVTTAAP